MKHLKIRMILSLALTLSVTLVFSLGWISLVMPTEVARGAEFTVCAAGCSYTTIQAAIDAAAYQDTIKVAAGTYNTLNTRGEHPQVVYVNKTVVIKGGYTTSFTEPPDPVANPTIVNAQGGGRAIYIVGAVGPTIQGLQITGGNAAGLEGDVSGNDAGGGIYATCDAKPILNDNQISGNNAFLGGGLYLCSGGATLSGNTFSANTAEYGGGVYLRNGDFSLTGNVFVSNSADYGAGLRLNDSQNSTFTNNTFTANVAVYRGGGIYQSSGNGVFSRNTFSQNSAEDGGGLYLIEAGTSVSQNTFSQNTADRGGGLYLLESETAEISANTISGNAVITGGGVYLDRSPISFSNNMVSANVADVGGGVYANSSAATLSSGNQVISNTARQGSGMYLYNSPATVSGNTFSQNAQPSGGVDTSGGGLYLLSSDATVSDNAFTANVADYGGGVYVRYGRPVLEENTFSENIGNDSGGGARLYDTYARLEHNTFLANTADEGAGLSLISLSRGYPILESNIITANVSQQHGGGVHLSVGNAELISNHIANNKAIFGSGGGLYLLQTYADAVLADNVILGNEATQDGGGMYLDSANSTIRQNEIANNKASQSGGGLYLYKSVARVEDNAISENSAVQNGGGIYLSSSEAAVEDNVISKNKARLSGGGFYVHYSPATLDRNLVLTNTARDNGGGLYLLQSDAELVNLIIAGNQIQDAVGCGLYVQASEPRLLHTTIVNNTGGDGSGVYVTRGTIRTSHVAMTNTILVNHTVGITVTEDNSAMLWATLWEPIATANLPRWGGLGSVTSVGDYTGDPVFTGTYRIFTGSAAIDMGVVTGITRDIDKEFRPYGDAPDLGADEFWPDLPLEYVYLPLVSRETQ